MMKQFQDFGLKDLVNIPGSNGGYNKKTFKKVYLVNPKECQNRSVWEMASIWRGSGHYEWEVYLAQLFLGAVGFSIRRDTIEADISDLFNRELLADGGRVFSQDAIYEHLMRTFEVVSETDEELRLRFKVI